MAVVTSPRGDLRQKVTNDKHLHFTVNVCMHNKAANPKIRSPTDYKDDHIHITSPPVH